MNLQDLTDTFVGLHTSLKIIIKTGSHNQAIKRLTKQAIKKGATVEQILSQLFSIFEHFYGKP